MVNNTAKKNKVKASISISVENYEWLKQLATKTHTSMSMFIEAFLTGARVSVQGGDEQEAMSLALEQMAKALKR